jgi:hypothetical protein
VNAAGGVGQIGRSPLITQARVAELTGLKRNKVSALVRAGLIPSGIDADGTRVIHEAEVLDWLRHGRVRLLRRIERGPSWRAVVRAAAVAIVATLDEAGGHRT